jgi:hypothetical protein
MLLVMVRVLGGRAERVRALGVVVVGWKREEEESWEEAIAREFIDVGA